MADRPAAIPMRTNNRRSLSGRFSTFAYTEPKPAAMSAVGPSRPADPPEPIVMAEASIFTERRVREAPRLSSEEPSQRYRFHVLQFRAPDRRRVRPI